MKTPDISERMEFFDGELSEERARAVEDHLARHPDQRAELSAWAAVGEWVRQDPRFQQDPDLTDAVLQRIERQRGAGGREARFGRRMGAWGLVAGGALAVAAAAAVWLGARSAPPAAPRAALPVEPVLGSAAPAPLAAPVESETVPAVAIESIDFGTHEGAIFVVGEDATPVVWLNDDDVGGGGEPL